jgi:uncharacterized membrane protein YhhN
MLALRTIGSFLMTTIAVLIVIGATAALVRAVVVASPNMRLLKMISSTGFIAVALSAGALSTPYGRIVLIALALSWLGDLLLTYESRQAFLGGLIIFLLGHVAYTVAFAMHGVNPVVGSITAAFVAIIALSVWRWLSPHVGDMSIPVIAYVVVISTMVVFAFATLGDVSAWLIPVGATLFFISDLFVARNQFVAPGTVNRVWGLPLYYTAQVLLALSIVN